MRVYSDGAARGNPGPSGAGAVLVEPSGQVVDRLGKFLGVQTNNFAEYMGLLIGLRRARQLGVQEVEVFADSELMIRQLNGRYQVKSPSLRPLYEEALRLLSEFQRVKLVHVPREMNAQADEMSNRAIDERL
jgi:ribonuclease HI